MKPTRKLYSALSEDEKLWRRMDNFMESLKLIPHGVKRKKPKTLK